MDPKIEREIVETEASESEGIQEPTLCLRSCGILSERRCMHRLFGRTGLRVALACEVI
jgi:hypothetical protein